MYGWRLQASISRQTGHEGGVNPGIHCEPTHTCHVHYDWVLKCGS